MFLMSLTMERCPQETGKPRDSDSIKGTFNQGNHGDISIMGTGF